MNKEELTCHQNALVGSNSHPRLAVRYLIWFADEFKLTGHLAIADCELLQPQLHVFNIRKSELETNVSQDHQPAPPCQAPAAILVLWFNH